jgi:hypothetical protein
MAFERDRRWNGCFWQTAGLSRCDGLSAAQQMLQTTSLGRYRHA